MRSALAISSALLAAVLPAVNATPEMIKVGCYSSSKGLNDIGSYKYQSSGYCHQQCLKGNSLVFALWKGSNCLCGDKLPPESASGAGSCNVACDGWPNDMCTSPVLCPVFGLTC